MDLYARINILDGRAVRLPRGNVADAIPLDADPLARGKSWVEQGADFVHIVDLDAAAYGDYRNRDLIDRIVATLDVPVQVAGGIRSPGEAARLLEQGAWRIVMGTAAIEDQNMVWDLCRDHAGKIVISLDVRPDEEVATRGWTKNSGRYLEEVLIEMSSAGVTAFLVAEAGRDALTDPPDLRTLAEALATVSEPVIASGGVRDLDDLRSLMRLSSNGRRLDGVIVGREVTAGRFTIEEAKKVMAEGVEDSLPVEEVARIQPEPSPAASHLESDFQRIAEECERAAAHARTAAAHLDRDDVVGAMAQGFSVAGHLRLAREALDEISERHQDYLGRRS